MMNNETIWTATTLASLAKMSESFKATLHDNETGLALANDFARRVDTTAGWMALAQPEDIHEQLWKLTSAAEALSQYTHGQVDAAVVDAALHGTDAF